MEEQTVKGVFLKNLVETLRRTKGPEGLKLLEERMGNIQYSSFKNYPLSLLVKLLNIAVEIQDGKYSKEGMITFGKMAFTIYAESVIGKTMFALFANDIKKAALGVQTALNTVTTNFPVEVTELADNKVSIRMSKNPHPIEYYEGLWTAAVTYFNQEGTVEAKELAANDYEYIISWNNH